MMKSAPTNNKPQLRWVKFKHENSFCYHLYVVHFHKYGYIEWLQDIEIVKDWTKVVYCLNQPVIDVSRIISCEH